MSYKTMTTLLIAALLLWVAGCSKNPVETPSVDQNLAEEFGGFTTADEAPAFGDPELAAVEDEEQEIDDPILASPAAQEVVNDINAGLFHFRAVWGRIPYDSTVTTVTDWSGSLTVTRGAIILRRLIRFELNQDTYLPRTSRDTLEWVSYTTVHNDGIAVDIFVPPMRPELDSSWVYSEEGDSTLVIDTIPPDPVTVTFATGPYTRTFTLAELASLQEVVTLEDGNKVALFAVQYFRQVCPRGILAGRWGFDEDGNGVFRGMWMSAIGHVIGYVQGRFGQNDEGRRVFYGKWIDRDGHFEGLLRGTWGHGPRVTDADIQRRLGAGWLAGEIFDSEGNSIGLLGGNFGSAPDVRGGWFQARWKLRCRQISQTQNGFGDFGDQIGESRSQ